LNKKSGKKDIVDIVKKSIVQLHSKRKNKNISKKISIVRSYSKTRGGSIDPGFVKNLLKISIESSIEDVKKTDESKEETHEFIQFEEKEEKKVSGGYGTITKSAGYAPNVKYVNYDKLWSHLGSFRTKGMYDKGESSNERAMKNGESSREMVSQETLSKAAAHFKYFARPASMEAHPDMYTVTGLVPPTGSGVNSKDWEKYALMMKMSIYQPILKLMAHSI
jgi:hypothetical protein